MSETNIKADASQSANFFSKLMSQNIAETKETLSENESIKEEIKEEVKEVKEETLKENAEFLQKTNTTPKSLSNNKMQIRIDEMQQEIERYKYIQKEQEMKLNIFKKTISTLQLQLQEKSSHISRLENDTKNTSDNNSKGEVVNNLTIQLKEKRDIIFSLEKEIESIQNELEQLKTNLQLHLNDKQSISNKYLEMRQEHQILDNDCQRQKEELNLKIEMLSASENKLQLEQNLKNSLQKELDLLKSQTSEYMKDIKNITFEKDNEILSLIKKIKTLEENNENENKLEINKVINKIPETMVLGRARGINTNLKRGMYPTTGPGFRPS